MSEIRLQKFLSQAGIASRRAAEKLILEGKVRVNGVIVRELGTKVDPEVDQVTCAGQKIQIQENESYILLHKPRQVLVTRQDPQNRKTVYELIPSLHSSVRSVGRLDYDSEGLLLMTNDGELAYRLTHPSYEVKKTYQVLVKQAPAPEKIRHLEKGVEIEGERTAPAKIQKISPALKSRGEESGVWFSVEIHEGKKRQVRRMFEWAGSKVLRLIRVRLGVLSLGNLAPGKWRELTPDEVLKLKKEVKM